MSKYLIDTNVLYHWAGLSESKTKVTPAQIDLLASRHELYIASPSVLEVCVHFRAVPQHVRRCLLKIAPDKLRFINDKRAPFSQDDLSLLLTANEAVTEAALDVMLERKIQAEGQFLTALLIETAVVVYSAFLEDGNTLRRPEHEELLVRYCSAVFAEPFSDFMKGHILASLRQGYRERSADRAAKDAFEAGLDILLRTYALNESAAAKGVAPTEFKTSDLTDKARGLVSKLRRVGQNKTVAGVLSKRHRDTGKLVLAQITRVMIADPREDPQSAHFVGAIIERVVVNGGKIEKNDLFDAMIMLSHFLVDRFVSEDRGFRDRANDVRPNFALSLEQALQI